MKITKIATRTVGARRTATRRAKPRILAYSPRGIVEICGCGNYYISTCGQNHSGNDGPGCGHYYSSTCGSNHSSKP